MAVTTGAALTDRLSLRARRSCERRTPQISARAIARIQGRKKRKTPRIGGSAEEHETISDRDFTLRAGREDVPAGALSQELQNGLDLLRGRLRVADRVSR